MSDDLTFLFLSGHILYTVLRDISLSVLHDTVRSLDETEVVDLSVDTQRGDQTDVRTLRRLDRAKTTVVRVVHVTYLEARALTGKTTRTEGGETTLVSDFGKRVRLIHELGKGVRSEERVDDGRDRLRVDQVDRSEHLIVADVHTLADCSSHTGQTDAELVVQLLAHRADTTVAQVVDIIDVSLRVDQLDQVLDDFDDILVSEDTHAHVSLKTQFLVDSVTANLTQVITLL